MHDLAANLLEAVWQGIDNDYKSRYRRTIWEQLENTVRAAAYTNNLGKFINSLCLKINAQIPAKHVARVEEILNSGSDKALLKLFRDETTYIVLMVRVRNQEKHDEWEEKQKQLFELEREEQQRNKRFDFFRKIYDKDGNFKDASIAADFEDYIRAHPDAETGDFLDALYEQFEKGTEE